MRVAGLQYFELLGTGAYLPRKQVLAAEIDARLGVAAGYTESTAGVHTRYECVAPESLASMAREAAQQALDDAQLSLSQIDLIVDASTSRHQPVPCNGALVSAALGPAAQAIPVFDVQSTCLGFVVALNVINGLLATGCAERVLLICSEAGLAAANWQEPESAALLGDGAGAVVLRRAAPRRSYAFAHQTFARYSQICEVRGGLHNLPAFAYRDELAAHYRFHMDGPRLFRVARQLLPPLVAELLNVAPCDRERLRVVPHQASPRAVEAVRRVLQVPVERYHNRVAEFGNLAAASIPHALDLCRRTGWLPSGTPVLLLGTSAGYSQAALIFET